MCDLAMVCSQRSSILSMHDAHHSTAHSVRPIRCGPYAGGPVSQRLDDGNETGVLQASDFLALRILADG